MTIADVPRTPSLANDVLREISKKPMIMIEGALAVPERQIWNLLAPADGIPKVPSNNRR